ncbi:uncharacterized protein LOC144817651 [Lissotriton helveticus]
MEPLKENRERPSAKEYVRPTQRRNLADKSVSSEEGSWTVPLARLAAIEYVRPTQRRNLVDESVPSEEGSWTVPLVRLAGKEYVRPMQRRNLVDESVPSEEGSWTVPLVRLETNTLKKYKRNREECTDKLQPRRPRAAKKEVRYFGKSVHETNTLKKYKRNREECTDKLQPRRPRAAKKEVRYFGKSVHETNTLKKYKRNREECTDKRQPRRPRAAKKEVRYFGKSVHETNTLKKYKRNREECTDKRQPRRPRAAKKEVRYFGKSVHETNTLKKYKRKLEECTDELQPRRARAAKKVRYSEKDEDDIWISGEEEEDVLSSTKDDEGFKYRPKRPKRRQNNTARKYSTERKFKKPARKPKSSKKIPRTHSGVKKYPCSDRGIVFIRKSNLIEHQVFHKKANVPGVKQKPLRKNSKANLNRNVSKSKYSDKKKRWNERKSASKHPQTSQAKKPHPCDECERSFNAYEMLLQHKRVHGSEKAFMHVDGKHHQKTPEKKPHPCDECERSFNAYEMLLQHKRVHANERASMWNDEKKNVSEPKSDSKTKVVKKASEKKPYPCSDCDLSFNSAPLLLQHQNVHTKEKVSIRVDEKKSVGTSKVETKASEKKPYPCTECALSFNCSAILLLHQKVHANGKYSIHHDEKNTVYELNNLVTDKTSTYCESEKCSHDSSAPQQPETDTSLNASICSGENRVSTLENNAPEKTSDESEKSLTPSSMPLQQQNAHTEEKRSMQSDEKKGDSKLMGETKLSKKKPFPCSECDLSFNSSLILLQHQNVHTKEKVSTRIDEKESVGTPKVETKATEKKPYPCTECEMSFNSSAILLLHQKVHANGKDSVHHDEKNTVHELDNLVADKTSTCCECEMCSHDSSAPQQPMIDTCLNDSICSDENRVSTLENNALEKTSDESEKSLSPSSMPLQQQNAHTKEERSMQSDDKKGDSKLMDETKAPKKKPYPCSECDLSFNSLLVLLHHQNVHTKENVSTRIDEKESVGTPKVETKAPEKKPYPCTECEMSFNSSVILLLHQKVHANGKDSVHHDEKNTVHELDNLVTDKTSTCCESEKCSHDSSAPQQSKTDTSLNASIFSDENCVSTLENNAQEKTSDDSEKSLTPSSMPLQQQKAHTKEGSMQSDEKKGDSKLMGETKAPEKKPYPCSECDLSFNSLLVLLHHQNVHTKENVSTRIDEKESVGTPKVETKAPEKKPYPCTECEMSFNSSVILLLHQKVHTNGKDSVHHDEKNTVHELDTLVADKMSTCCECEMCSHDSSAPQQPETDTSLNDSICSDENRVSTLENNAPEETSDESEKSLTPSSMPLQQQKAHTKEGSMQSYEKKGDSKLMGETKASEKKPFPCSECDLSFNSSLVLLQHQNVHKKEKVSTRIDDKKNVGTPKVETKTSEKKPYPCSNCDLSFNSASLLLQHQKTHTKEKRSIQSDEKKGISKLMGETKASEKKPYPCSECDLSFNSSLVLLQHQNVHTTEKVSTRVYEKKSVGTPMGETKAPEKKPYPCTECEMSFNSSAILLLHQKVHPNGKDSIHHDEKSTVHELDNLVTDKTSTCCESEMCSHDSSAPQQPMNDTSLNASICSDENIYSWEWWFNW